MIPLIWKCIKFITIKVYFLIYVICFFRKPHFHDWGEWEYLESGFREFRFEPGYGWKVRIEHRICNTCYKAVKREINV